MIAVDPAQLNVGFEEMKAIHATLHALLTNIDDMRQRLSETTSGDINDSFLSLSKESEKLATLILQHKHLCQVLDAVCHLYSACEERIYDSGEGAAIEYRQPMPTCLDLSETSKLLREFSFEIKRSEESWLLDNLK